MKTNRHLPWIAFLFALSVWATTTHAAPAAPAAPPEEPDEYAQPRVSDPFAPVNRAVFKFNASSRVFSCSMGISVGFAPRRILSM